MMRVLQILIHTCKTPLVGTLMMILFSFYLSLISLGFPTTKCRMIMLPVFTLGLSLVKYLSSLKSCLPGMLCFCGQFLWLLLLNSAITSSSDESNICSLYLYPTTIKHSLDDYYVELFYPFYILGTRLFVWSDRHTLRSLSRHQYAASKVNSNQSGHSTINSTTGKCYQVKFTMNSHNLILDFFHS